MESPFGDCLIELLLRDFERLSSVDSIGNRRPYRFDPGAELGLGRFVARLTDDVLTVALDL